MLTTADAAGRTAQGVLETVQRGQCDCSGGSLPGSCWSGLVPVLWQMTKASLSMPASARVEGPSAITLSRSWRTSAQLAPAAIHCRTTPVYRSTRNTEIISRRQVTIGQSQSEDDPRLCSSCSSSRLWRPGTSVDRDCESNRGVWEGGFRQGGRGIFRGVRGGYGLAALASRPDLATLKRWLRRWATVRHREAAERTLPA
jgi:hypothetical protein